MTKMIDINKHNLVLKEGLDGGMVFVGDLPLVFYISDKTTEVPIVPIYDKYINREV